MLRYFRWQVPLEQGTTDILNWMILSRGAVLCIVLIHINTSIPDYPVDAGGTISPSCDKEDIAKCPPMVGG